MSKWHFFILQVTCSSLSHRLVNSLFDVTSEQGLAGDKNQQDMHIEFVPLSGWPDLGSAAQAWAWRLWPLQVPQSP